MTASGLAHTEQEAVEAGADGFVRKPYKEGDLLAAIGEQIGVRYIYDSPASVTAADDGLKARPSTLSQQLSLLPPAAHRSIAQGRDRRPRQTTGSAGE